MERDEVTRWLDGYVKAWQANDRERIVALFSSDAAYRFHPYDDPVIGAEAIAEQWLSEPDEPGSWEASYRAVAVDGDTAVAVGTSRYAATSDRPALTYHNCFVIRFTPDGRCRQFTEWFMQEPQ